MRASKERVEGTDGWRDYDPGIIGWRDGSMEDFGPVNREGVIENL